MDFAVIIPAMKEALCHATIADPTAVRELALDLDAIAVWERGGKKGALPWARPPILRAARTMVRLRRRFNKLPGYDNDEGHCSDSLPLDAHFIEDGEEFTALFGYSTNPDATSLRSVT